jgi:hypothetical protein
VAPLRYVGRGARYPFAGVGRSHSAALRPAECALLLGLQQPQTVARPPSPPRRGPRPPPHFAPLVHPQSDVLWGAKGTSAFGRHRDGSSIEIGSSIQPRRRSNLGVDPTQVDPTQVDPTWVIVDRIADGFDRPAEMPEGQGIKRSGGGGGSWGWRVARREGPPRARLAGRPVPRADRISASIVMSAWKLAPAKRARGEGPAVTGPANPNFTRTPKRSGAPNP